MYITVPQAKYYHPGEFICALLQKNHTSWTWLFSSLMEGWLCEESFTWVSHSSLPLVVCSSALFVNGTLGDRGSIYAVLGKPLSASIGKGFLGTAYLWGRRTHHPVCNPSHVLCKEAQLTHCFPRVNSGWMVPGSTIGTFW